MSLLLSILLNNIVPIFLAIGAGFALARFTRLDPSPISKAILYVFAPSFVFSLLTTIEIQPNEVVRIVAVCVASVLASGVLAWLVARAIGLERVMTSALMIVAMFTNSGNYGLSLNQLAFGDEAVARAVLYFVTSSTLTYTLGVYLASSGRLSAWGAFKSLLRIPTLYAVLLALLATLLKVKIPNPISTPIDILGRANIPVMLLLLGIQMAGAGRLVNWRELGLASALRLAVAPAIALGLVAVLNLTGPARQASVIEASMPTAVAVTVLATEFDVEPGFVTSSVFLSTLLSPISLTLLIAFLS